jgi:hypothetical protein
MQTETRSLLGLLLWVSLAYPQISHCVNKACGFMSNPSHEVNAYAKHIALHLYQYPVAVKSTIFKDFTKDVPGERVYSDQCMAGAETRKSTQWYCNDVILPAAFKYLGTLVTASSS